MVKKITHNKKEFYQCEECKMHYNTDKLAGECEGFCKKNNACNTEIIKHAVQLD